MSAEDKLEKMYKALDVQNMSKDEFLELCSLAYDSVWGVHTGPKSLIMALAAPDKDDDDRTAQQLIMSASPLATAHAAKHIVGSLPDKLKESVTMHLAKELAVKKMGLSIDEMNEIAENADSYEEFESVMDARRTDKPSGGGLQFKVKGMTKQ